MRRSGPKRRVFSQGRPGLAGSAVRLMRRLGALPPYVARSSLIASPAMMTSKTARSARRSRERAKAPSSPSPGGSPAPRLGGVAPSRGRALPAATYARRAPSPTRGPVPGATAAPEVPAVPSATSGVDVDTGGAVRAARVRIRRWMRLLSAGETPPARSRRTSAFKRRSRRARSRTETDPSISSNRLRFARAFRPSSIRSRSLSSRDGNRSNVVRKALPGEVRAEAVPESTASPAVSPRPAVESPTEPGWDRSPRASSGLVSVTSGVVSVTTCALAQGTRDVNAKRSKETNHFMRQPRVDPTQDLPDTPPCKRRVGRGGCGAGSARPPRADRLDGERRPHAAAQARLPAEALHRLEQQPSPERCSEPR